jgi:hypothetical protein
MSHAVDGAVRMAALGSRLGALIEQLVALRTDVDATAGSLSGQRAGPSAPANAKPVGPGQAAAATADEELAGLLDELGVIGCVLGLRPGR